MISQVQMYDLGVVWVGGWGFMFFAYPELVCRIFRVKNPTPKRLKLIKITGAVELVLVFSASVYWIRNFRFPLKLYHYPRCDLLDPLIWALLL